MAGIRVGLVLSGVVVVATCLLGIAVIIGHKNNGGIVGKITRRDVNVKESSGESSKCGKLTKETDSEIAERIHKEIRTSELKKHFRKLVKKPRVAGTPGGYKRAMHVKQRFLDFGVDEVNILPYDVLLSYPGDAEKNPNVLQILERDSTVVHQASPTEPILVPEMNRTDFLPPYLAYTPSGDVEGELVYANRGSLEDFKQLTDQLGIDVTDKIVIARYGQVYRGDKIKHAQMFGAKGVILFSDPEDVTKEGEDVFPNSAYLPEYGVQGGTTLQTLHGDPLTPGYPAIGNISERITIEEAEIDGRLVKIPAIPISYGDAIKFFESMDPSNAEAPLDWRGKMKTTYRLGPKMVNNRTVRLLSHNKNEIRTTHNVIGVIKGSVEPDRYVMIGAHHDAWMLGAIDNAQGTTFLLELARVFGKLLRETCWRPRRSIVFASWGAEEFGLIGSTEFVEEFSKILEERAVAYINADVTVVGLNLFIMLSSPILTSVIYRASEFVDSPESEFPKFRDIWLSRDKILFNDPNRTSDDPTILKLGARSDHAPFYNFIGVPSMNSGRFLINPDSYPLYHSGYETSRAVKKFIDPTFKYQQSIVRLDAEIVRLLSDEFVLPMDVRYLSKDVTKMFVDVKSRFETKLNVLGVTLTEFEKAVKMFETATGMFSTMVDNVDQEDPVAVRMLNDKIMMVERAFLDPLGLPGRPLYRNLMQAPSRSNAAISVGFPGVVDAIADFDEAAATKKAETQLRVIRKEIARATFALRSAASTLLGHVGFER